MRVEPQWIDYNGHLNMAYYNVLFDRAVDEVYELIGLGPDYLKQHGHSTMVPKCMCAICANCMKATRCGCRSNCSITTPSAFHLFEQLLHATENWVSATSESMTLHVDMAAKKVAPFPDSVMRLIERMKAAHAELPRPEGAGRSIKMPGKSFSRSARRKTFAPAR